MQTEIALDHILPSDQSQQNSILKKMVCQQRKRIGLLEEEMQQLQLQLNTIQKGKQSDGEKGSSIDDLSKLFSTAQSLIQPQEEIHKLNQKMENEFIKLKTSQNEYQKLIIQYREQMQKKDTQINELIGQLKSSEIVHRGRLEEANQKLNKYIQELNDAKKQLYYAECNNKRITQDANKKITELKHRLQITKAQLTSQSDLLHQQNTDIQLYQQNYKQIYDNSTSENIRKLIQQVQDLESQINGKNQQIQQQKEQMVENELRAQKTLRDQLQEQQENLQNENKQKIQEIIVKAQQQAQYMKEISDQQVQQLRNEINELVLLNQEINQQQKQLQMKNIQFEQKFSQQQLKYDKAVQRAKNRYQILEQSIEALNNDNHDLSQENSKKQASVIRLKEQIATLKEDLEKERQMSEQLKDNILQINNQNKELNVLINIKDKQLMTNNQTRFELKQALEQKQQIITNFDNLRLENIKLTDNLAGIEADNHRLLQTVVQKDEQIQQLRKRIQDIQNISILSQLQNVHELSNISNLNVVKQIDASLNHYIKSSVSQLSEQAINEYEQHQNKKLALRQSKAQSSTIEDQNNESSEQSEEQTEDQNNEESNEVENEPNQEENQVNDVKQPEEQKQEQNKSQQQNSEKAQEEVIDKQGDDLNNVQPVQQTSIHLSTQDTYEVITNLLQESQKQNNKSQLVNDYANIANSSKHNVTAFLPPEMNTQTINGIKLDESNQNLPQAPPITDNLLSTDTLLKKYQNINNGIKESKNNKIEDELDLDLA